MASINLETIPVSELELGMIVHGIAEQAGKLTVKNKGKVNHLRLIDQLSSHGVVSVVVEKPKANANQALVRLHKQKQRLQSHKNNTKNQDNIKSTVVATELSLELEQASKLVKQSIALHKSYSTSIKKELQLDFTEARNLVSAVYQSLARNPNALLCLSMMMNSNEYLANHAIHCAILLCYFGQSMGLSEQECERLGMVGYFFDIGMIKVPDHILNKKDSLTAEEQSLIQYHVYHSLELLAPLKLDSDMLLAIEQHHERLDGSGYPNGYAGSKIHKYSRMLAIVDSYDALTTNRVFKLAHSPASALKILSDPNFGYDQKLVLQFVRCIGIYPVGSLVILSNKRIALVTKNHLHKPSAPEIKVFYSIIGGHYLEPKMIDLAKQSNDLKIVKPVLAEQYKLDLSRII